MVDLGSVTCSGAGRPMAAFGAERKLKWTSAASGFAPEPTFTEGWRIGPIGWFAAIRLVSEMVLLSHSPCSPSDHGAGHETPQFHHGYYGRGDHVAARCLRSAEDGSASALRSCGRFSLVVMGHSVCRIHPGSGRFGLRRGAQHLKETRCRQAINNRFGAIDRRQSDRSGAPLTPLPPAVPTNDRSGAGAAVRITEIEWPMSDREQSDGAWPFWRQIRCSGAFHSLLRLRKFPVQRVREFSSKHLR
jgi:hypothetical protein